MTYMSHRVLKLSKLLIILSIPTATLNYDCNKLCNLLYLLSFHSTYIKDKKIDKTFNDSTNTLFGSRCHYSLISCERLVKLRSCVAAKGQINTRYCLIIHII